ncbi:MAG: class GN sortase [Alphaproteobacteria bacterium]|nr:class GN sortase [Alphaproteobacteria bacterium]
MIRNLPGSRPSLLLAGAAGLLGLGVWQLGGAAWIHGKAAVAQVLLERAWDARRSGAENDAARPWPWADTAPVARLRVPAHGIDQVVLAGASGRTLAFGPGHLTGTAAPGYRGHSVVSGHRDTHFTFLKDLKPGDAVELERPDGRRVIYRLTGSEIVDARTARFAGGGDRSVVSLVTCYPFEALVPNGPLRYVVTAEAVERPPASGVAEAGVAEAASLE